jgi:exfoliative toxin A/B
MRHPSAGTEGPMVSVKNAVRRVPVPAAGLMLGLATLGKLLSSYGMIFKTLFGAIALLILVLLLIKIAWDTKVVMEDLQNPAIAGISATFPMGITVLATYFQPFCPLLAYGLCGIGMFIHCRLIIYYTKRFILHFTIQKIFPSCFVIYVGIAIFSVIAPIFNLAGVGQMFFWFGFITYLILLPIISYRVIVIKSIPEALLPTMTIFAAPASLCLAGYLNSFSEKNIVIVWLLTFLSLAMLLGVLLSMPQMLKLKFFPSYSAFTFPLVISAVALKRVENFLVSLHQVVPVFRYLVPIEEILATVFAIYVLVRYIGFLFLSNVSGIPQNRIKQYSGK